MFIKLLTIFAGGGIGALLRYGASLLAGKYCASALPGTFAVNMIGCLALGAVYGATQGKLACLSEEMRLFISVGLLGALTTFSTLSWETLALLRAGRFMCGAAYLLLSCALGLLCAGVGYYLAHGR